jgi:hypothetical protein
VKEGTIIKIDFCASSVRQKKANRKLKQKGQLYFGRRIHER